jgi:hypothetical protein
VRKKDGRIELKKQKANKPVQERRKNESITLFNTQNVMETRLTELD